MGELNLRITGMTCAGCGNSVHTALANAPGISEVEVSHIHGKANVVFDPRKTSRHEIIELINHMGYSAVAKPADPVGSRI